MSKELESYSRIIKIRNLLKRVNQLSWNINQFEKRFPFDQLDASDFLSIEKSYTDFIEELLKIVNEFEMNKNEKQSIV